MFGLTFSSNQFLPYFLFVPVFGFLFFLFGFPPFFALFIIIVDVQYEMKTKQKSEPSNPSVAHHCSFLSFLLSAQLSAPILMIL
mmetsp:Transcript_26527/g.67999  ORF Transcript_26527/g.67999 Transcript_26527/m.67999 type:complete len:84 (-) Transcript_26527:4563-4814(-)